MSILRKVEFEQADFMWQYQLRYERDVVAQVGSLPSAFTAHYDEKKSAFYSDGLNASKCGSHSDFCVFCSPNVHCLEIYRYYPEN